LSLSSGEIETLKDLEENLWRSETRFDLNFQQKIFAPDFFEFGRSGRRYTRDQMIITEPKSIVATFPLKDFKIHQLDKMNVLITYISEVQHEEFERANRCSVWSKTSDGWKLRFHQGTPTAEGVNK